MHLVLVIVLVLGNGILIMSFLGALWMELVQGGAAAGALTMLAVACLNLFAAARLSRLGSEEARLASELRKARMRHELAEIAQGGRNFTGPVR
jgi:hypothetical protein